MPLRRKSIPSVVMNEGTPRERVITPFVEADERAEKPSADEHADPDRAAQSVLSEETT